MKSYKTINEALDVIDSDTTQNKPTNHNQDTIDRMDELEPGEQLYESYNCSYRLYGDRPAPTIFGDGWKYVHPVENRGLTLRERACIQSFPSEFVFVGGRKTSRYKQVANAVPPRLARSIGQVVQ